MEIHIDTRQATDSLRSTFRHLTEQEYGKAVYLAINESLKRGRSMVSKDIKKHYTNIDFPTGSLRNGLRLRGASQRKWIGHVDISRKKLTFKHFDPKKMNIVYKTGARYKVGDRWLPSSQRTHGTLIRNKRGKGSAKYTGGVSVELEKGRRNLFSNTFIPKKSSMNGHVYSKGRYIGNRFVPNDKNLTAMLGHGLNNLFAKPSGHVADGVKDDLEVEYPRRLTRILKSMTDGTFAQRKRPVGLS